MSSSFAPVDPAPTAPTSNTGSDSSARILQTLLSRLDGLELRIATLDTARSDLPPTPADAPFQPPTAPVPALDSLDPADYLDPRDWLEFLPVEYVNELP